VFSMADRSTAPTEELARELRDYGVKNVSVLPNGVDLGALRSDERQEKAFMDRYDVPAGKKLILFVGRMGFEKRLEVLLMALRKLKSKDWCLVAVGGGPQLESYMQEADALDPGQVVFTGFVRGEMLNAAYACADIFVSPSDSETFGLTFVEAMAFGLPAIGADRLGPKEIIRDGKNGFLVKPGDSEALAARIGQLLGDDGLRARMGEEALKTSKEHSIERSADMTLGIYGELLKRKK
jgi:1,2-diacylglycerol 3-alpha-glucosyltransferase